MSVQLFELVFMLSMTFANGGPAVKPHEINLNVHLMVPDKPPKVSYPSILSTQTSTVSYPSLRPLVSGYKRVEPPQPPAPPMPPLNIRLQPSAVLSQLSTSVTRWGSLTRRSPARSKKNSVVIHQPVVNYHYTSPPYKPPTRFVPAQKPKKANTTVQPIIMVSRYNASYYRRTSSRTSTTTTTPQPLTELAELLQELETSVQERPVTTNPKECPCNDTTKDYELLKGPVFTGTSEKPNVGDLEVDLQFDEVPKGQAGMQTPWVGKVPVTGSPVLDSLRQPNSLREMGKVPPRQAPNTEKTIIKEERDKDEVETLYSRLNVLQERMKAHENKEKLETEVTASQDSQAHETNALLKQFYSKLNALQDKVNANANKKNLQSAIKHSQDADDHEKKALLQQFYTKLNALQERVKVHENNKKLQNNIKDSEAHENKALLKQFYAKLNALQEKVNANENNRKLQNAVKEFQDSKAHDNKALQQYYKKLNDLQKRINAHEHNKKLQNAMKKSQESKAQKDEALLKQFYNKLNALQERIRAHEDNTKLASTASQDSKAHGSEVVLKQFYNKLNTLQEKIKAHEDNKKLQEKIKEMQDLRALENKEKLDQFYSKLGALQERINAHENRERLENALKRQQDAKARENKLLMQQFYNRLNALQERIKVHENDKNLDNAMKQQQDSKTHENKNLLKQVHNKLNALQEKVNAQESDLKPKNPVEVLQDYKEQENDQEPENAVEESQDSKAQESEEEPETANDESPDSKAQENDDDLENVIKESQDSKLQDNDNEPEKADKEDTYDSNFSEDNEADESQPFVDFWGTKVPKYEKDLKGVRQTKRERAVKYHKAPDEWNPEYTKGLLSEDDDTHVAVISGFQHMPKDEEHHEEQAGEILQNYGDDSGESQEAKDKKGKNAKDNGTSMAGHHSPTGTKSLTFNEPVVQVRPLDHSSKKYGTFDDQVDFLTPKKPNSKTEVQAGVDVGIATPAVGVNKVNEGDMLTFSLLSKNDRKEQAVQDKKEEDSGSEEEKSEDVPAKSVNIPAEMLAPKDANKKDQVKKTETVVQGKKEDEADSGSKEEADMAPKKRKKKAIKPQDNKKEEVVVNYGKEKIPSVMAENENKSKDQQDRRGKEKAVKVEKKKRRKKKKRKKVNRNKKEEELDFGSEDKSEYVLAENANIPADMLEHIGRPPDGALCKTVGNVGGANNTKKNGMEMSEVRGFSCAKDYDEADDGNDITKEDIEKSLEKSNEDTSL